MILLDANVLTALIDPADALRQRAMNDLRVVAKSQLLLAEPALAETFYLTPDPHLRRKIPGLLQQLNVQAISESPERIWPAVFEWLEKYSEHSPDWTDAYLIVLCDTNPKLTIWTYDREFYTIWRRTDGTRIPMAIEAIR